MGHSLREGPLPENIVWIFGTGRSGNTWLASMMRDLPRHELWTEPRVGQLFGGFYEDAPESERRSAKFVLGAKYRDAWIGGIRAFVMQNVSGRFGTLSPEGYVVVKEQVGSVGAPLLMEALPESRMILLVRGPRDVVASALDGASEGGWALERRKRAGTSPVSASDPSTIVEIRASHYARNLGKAKEAYDAHAGPKVRVKYERLRVDALGEMRRIYSTLGIPVDDGELSRVVKKHSWENIPEKEKGQGKFFRKASPGSWREDLTEEQVARIAKITGPLLEEFYR